MILYSFLRDACSHLSLPCERARLRRKCFRLGGLRRTGRFYQHQLRLYLQIELSLRALISPDDSMPFDDTALAWEPSL